MKEITYNQLKTIKQCPYKAYINSLGLITETTRNFEINKLYKSVILDYDFLKLSQDELLDILNSSLDEKFFFTKQERNVVVQTMYQNLKRYIDYERKQGRTILYKNYSNVVNIDNCDTGIKITADLVFLYPDNTIEMSKILISPSGLSYKARNEENLPENDIGLYLLGKLGEIFVNNEKSLISRSKNLVNTTKNNGEISMKSSFLSVIGKNDKDYFKTLLEDNGRNKLLNKLAEYEDAVDALEINYELETDKQRMKFIKSDLTANKKQAKLICDALYYENTEGNNIHETPYFQKNYLDRQIIELCENELSEKSKKCESSDCQVCHYSVKCKCHIDDMQLEAIPKKEGKISNIKPTEAQQRVINFNKGFLRVNSVAGSGKTQSMVTRYLKLIKDGNNPEDILMITFTESGAKEIKDRIGKLAIHNKIDFDLSKLEIYTFNSFGMKFINDYEEKSYSIATNIHVYDIIKDLLNEIDDIEWLDYKNPLMNFPYAKGAFVQVKNIIDLMKSYDKDTVYKIALQRYLVKDGVDSKRFLDGCNILLEKFDKLLDEKNLIQYQDQILKANKIYDTADKDFLHSYRHIVVDEYQDTDFHQVKLLKNLCNNDKFESLCVVGDDSQAIYGFRNTTPENIINFDKEFDNVKDEFLLENFRSTPEICNLANEFVKLNENRIDKDIVSKKEHGKQVQFIGKESKDDELDYIVNDVKNKLEIGYNLTDICIINRKKSKLLELKQKLNKENIPCNVEVSERYLDNSNVKLIINLAKLLSNPLSNTYYAYECLNSLRIENMTFEDYCKTLDNYINSELTEDQDYPDKETRNIEYFFDLSSKLATDDNSKEFLESLMGLNLCSLYELLDYIRKIELYMDETAIPKEDIQYNAITLTTAHSSKGKEWKVVCLLMDDFEYFKYVDELEEERRLIFVAITRAKDELQLVYENKVDKKGNEKHSKFIDEILDLKY